MPPAWAGSLPEAGPPPGMAVYQLPTGTYETRAAFAVRSGSFRDKRHFAATATLVQRPKGDLLIDAGFGSGVAATSRSCRGSRALPIRRPGPRASSSTPAATTTAGYWRAGDPFSLGPRERPRRAAGTHLDEPG